MTIRNDSTWRIMQDNKYVLIGEVSKDMICLICRKLLINATYGPCGCRYCKTCIISYLQGNDKPCPGNSNDCCKKTLNFIEDIHNDEAQNLLIRKLIVKCPQANCNVTNELRHMEDHLNECSINPDNIGNNSAELNNFSRVNHENGINSQSKFLLESFDNLKNENETLKKDLFRFKNEVELNRNLYIEKINRLEMIGERNGLKMEEINQEMEIVKNENRRLTEEMENLRNNDEIDRMKRKIEGLEEILSQQTIELNQLKQNWNFFNNTKISNKDEINPSYFQINNLEISDYITNDESSEIIQFDEIPKLTINYGPFEWKFENISKYESNKWINSEPYFTHENGYKFCLWVKYNISKLDSGLSFMQGEYDNDLSWPFKHGFTVELVNSYYRKAMTYKNDPENVGWKKPLGSLCSIITFYRNTSLHHSFIENDCMTIRCFVDL